MPSSTEASPFAFLAGSLCLDFVNTAFRQDGVAVLDALDSYGHLLAWGLEAGILSAAAVERLGAQDPAEVSAALARAVAFRERVYRVFAAVAEGREADADELDGLNRELAGAFVQRRLVGEGSAFRWEWPDAALDTVLWRVAESAAELLTGAHLERVRRCAGEDCTRLFLDTSRNGRRRWCDMSHCGNIAKVRRFRTRHGTARRPPAP